MEYKVQVGKVAFSIETPFPYRWQTVDEAFELGNIQAERTIQVNIHSVQALESPKDTPVHQEEGVKIWQVEEEEIRSYQDMFAAGHPVYALSRWKGHEIDLAYCDSSNVWNNPNLRLWNLLHLENQLLLTDSLILHCCYTQYQGEGILFTAPSGTGKTTQAEIWKRVYQSEIINGDKGLLQKEKTGWNVCGFPLHGSAPECENCTYPIRAIVVVRQAAEDRVETLSPIQKLGLLYSECTVNSWDEKKVQKALDLLTDLTARIPVVMLHCTMNDSAAHVLHRYLYGE